MSVRRSTTLKLPLPSFQVSRPVGDRREWLLNKLETGALHNSPSPLILLSPASLPAVIKHEGGRLVARSLARSAATVSERVHTAAAP